MHLHVCFQVTYFVMKPTWITYENCSIHGSPLYTHMLPYTLFIIDTILIFHQITQRKQYTHIKKLPYNHWNWVHCPLHQEQGSKLQMTSNAQNWNL